VTVFNVTRTLEQNATKLVHQWQSAIGKFDEDLFSRIFLSRANTSQEGKTTILAVYTSLFLDGVDRLLSMMQQSFPQLGLVKEDCIEMSWIESTVYFARFPRNTSLDVLLDRRPGSTRSFKGKTDYVTEPIPEIALEGIWERLNQLDAQVAQLQFTAYGGKMDEISETSIPFPHRAGNLFQIHYAVFWGDQDSERSQKYTSWIRKLYSYMTPYVTKNPRQAYINYRDLDLGMNTLGNTSYKQARIWGTKYFKNNFDRLVHVKTKVDPANFFRNEQSIPPLSSW